MTAIKRSGTALALVAMALALAWCFAPKSAHAASLDELQVSYQVATVGLERAIAEQEENAANLVDVNHDIVEAQERRDQAQEQLDDAIVMLYKGERHRSDLLSLLLESESLSDAIARYDGYARIQGYYKDTLDAVVAEQNQLAVRKTQLEEERVVLEARVEDSRIAVQDAEAALRDADHSDGADYHQTQGNGANCGATSFTVGLNILLHEEAYTDNVAVWEGPGFEGDSTQSMAWKGATWLMANGLADVIGIETVPGDIFLAGQLKASLEQGNVVIISSGSGSVWQHADGTEAGPGAHPDGHWIVFYYYEDGVFYANDSSCDAEAGAGCAYSEEQMQQWLDGRGSHFATIMYKK